MTTEKLETALRERRVRRLAGLAISGIVVTIVALSVPAFAATRSDSAQSAATITTAVRQGTSATSTSLTTSTTAAAAPETTTTTNPPLSPAEELAAKISAMTPEEATAFIKFTSPPPPTTTTAAPKPQPKPTTPAAPPAGATQEAPHQDAAPQASSGGAPGGFLACVRQRESKGQYGINTGNGYYGAYQFSQVTWNNTVNHAGRGDLNGVPPSSASPADQDAMAQHLLGWQGRAPWAGGGC